MHAIENTNNNKTENICIVIDIRISNDLKCPNIKLNICGICAFADRTVD